MILALLGRILFWLSWPALYVYLRGTTRTRVMIEAEGKILLIKGWHDGQRWALPGGGVHRGEEPLASALREVEEETGVVLQASQMIYLDTDQYNVRGLRYSIERFGYRLDSQPPIRRQKREVLATRWFAPEEITPDLVEPNVLKQLEAWQQIR